MIETKAPRVNPSTVEAGSGGKGGVRVRGIGQCGRGQWVFTVAK